MDTSVTSLTYDLISIHLPGQWIRKNWRQKGQPNNDRISISSRRLEKSGLVFQVAFIYILVYINSPFKATLKLLCLHIKQLLEIASEWNSLFIQNTAINNWDSSEKIVKLCQSTKTHICDQFFCCCFYFSQYWTQQCAVSGTECNSAGSFLGNICFYFSSLRVLESMKLKVC